jgi:hypothetical protein
MRLVPEQYWDFKPQTTVVRLFSVLETPLTLCYFQNQYLQGARPQEESQLGQA